MGKICYIGGANYLEVGIMMTFNPREYSIRELYDSYQRGETVLSPKFQRRAVWEYKAKSYLIDSILRGFPVPRIFIREKTALTFKTSREIIDGQQRLKTVFDFIQDGFKISKVHNDEFGGLTFNELPDLVRKDFLNYTISAIILMDLTDDEVFNIFARLNTYSVRLNSQELLNSQFFGRYKQLIYRVAGEYRKFWVESRILTEKSIARMEDAKLISEIISVIVDGNIVSSTFETSKKIYQKFDDDFPLENEIEANLKFVLDLICKIYGDSIGETAFAKIPLFYSLVLVLYHMVKPISCFSIEAKNISESDIPKIKTALDEIDSVVTVSDDESLNDQQKGFILTLNKNTTTPNVRLRRCNYLGQMISRYL